MSFSTFSLVTARKQRGEEEKEGSFDLVGIEDLVNKAISISFLSYGKMRTEGDISDCC